MKNLIGSVLVMALLLSGCASSRRAVYNKSFELLNPSDTKIEVRHQNGLYLGIAGGKNIYRPVSEKVFGLFEQYEDTAVSYNGFLEAADKRENITRSGVGMVASGLLMASFGSMFFGLIQSLAPADELSGLKSGMTIVGISIAGLGLLTTVIFGIATDIEMMEKLQQAADVYNAHCE